jgi:hypothetical protein
MSIPDPTTPATLIRIRWQCAAMLAALQTAALLLLGLPFVLAGDLFDAAFLGDLDRAR